MKNTMKKILCVVLVGFLVVCYLSIATNQIANAILFSITQEYIYFPKAN